MDWSAPSLTHSSGPFYYIYFRCNQLEKLEAAKAAWLVYLSLLSLIVVMNIQIRIRIRIFSSESRIFGFGFVIFVRRIIFGFGFVTESWPPNLNLFNIFNLKNLAMKYKLNSTEEELLLKRPLLVCLIS